MTRMLLVLLATIVSMGGTALQADPEIVLAPGDTISFTILGAPSLSHSAVVGADGNIRLPVVGQVNAAGVSMTELQRTIGALISDRPFRVVSSTGEDSWRRVGPNEVFVDIAEYRPVYVTGTVRQSGELPFRPGLTARQALAQAGGVGLEVLENISPLQIIELGTQRDLLIHQIGFQRETLARLELDLSAVGESSAVEFVNNIPQPSEAEGSARWLSARGSQRESDELNLQIRLEQLENRLEVLRAVQASNETNQEIEEGLLERARTLVERGVAPAATLDDARRAALLVQQQQLETTSEIFRLELEIARTMGERDAGRFANQISLLEQIVDGQAQLAGLHLRLQALDERITFLGGDLMVALSQQEPTPIFILHRSRTNETFTLRDLDDTILQPGDVLSVRLDSLGGVPLSE